LLFIIFYVILYIDVMIIFGLSIILIPVNNRNRLDMTIHI